MSGATRIADRFATIERKRREQTVFANGASQAAANTASTTNTATYVDAMTWAWDELPDGLYVVTADGSFTATHSAAGQIEFRLVCNGEASGQHTLSVGTARERVEIVRTFTEVEAAGGTGIVLELEYKNDEDDPGTATARNPAISATAVKVG